MKLLRIVIATFDPDPKVQKSWSLQYGDTNVSTMRINVPEDKIWTTIFVAEKEIEFPKFNDDGFVLIPDSDRRELEFSLETIANVISVFGRCKRTISSAHPCVALVTDNQKELKKQVPLADN